LLNNMLLFGCFCGFKPFKVLFILLSKSMLVTV